ncbi:hypothetical protein ES703_19785 [subsurface metagenome]
MNPQRSPVTNFLIRALPFLIISTVSLIALHRVLFTPGLILYGDFVSTFDVKLSLVNSYPLWNSYGSYPVPADNALWFFGPAAAIASALQIPAEWFYKLLILGIMLLTGLSMYYAANILIKQVVKGWWIAFTGAIIAALVYMFNPWVLPHITHIPLWVGYALSPLVLICFMKALKSGRFIYVIATAFLWSVASVDPRYIVFSGILILSWLAFSLLGQFKAGDKSTALSYIKITALVVALYIPFNAFWILPHAATGQITPLYQISTEDIIDISRNSSLINVIRFMGFWGPWGTGAKFYEPASQSLYYPWLASSFIVPLFAFASLIFRPNNNGGLKYASYFSLMCIPLIFLGMGTQSPFPSVYNWLVFDIPFFSERLGWIFREPDKWVGLLALMLCFLIALTIAGIFSNGWKISNPASGALRRGRKKLSSILVKGTLIAMTLLFVLSFALFVAPADSHFFAGFLVPHKVPQEYYDTNDWLASQDGDFKVMYLPQIPGPTEWGPQDLSRMFLPWSITAKTTIVGDPFTAPSVDYFYNYIYYDSLLENETVNFGKYLAPLNKRYLIIHDDTTWSWEKEKVDTAIDKLKNQNDLSFLGQNGFVYIFENENYAPYIFVPSQNFLVSGGVDMMTPLNAIEAFDPNTTGLLYLDHAFSDGYPNADGVVLSRINGMNDVALSQVADRYLIVPFGYTDRFLPSYVWSKVRLVNWHWFWGRQPIASESWDLEYGKGFVTNVDLRPTTEPVPPRHIETGDAGEWRTVTSSPNDHVNISSDGESLILDYTFDNEDSLCIYAMTEFEKENWESYDTRSMWVYGDGSGNRLGLWYRQTHPDGTTKWYGTGECILDWVGWKEVSDTIPEVLRVRASGFQIALSWDINKSQAGLGSHRIMVKDIVLKDERDVGSSSRRRLDIPVEIEESGPYRLYARVLESAYGGELSILLEGQKIASVNTKARESNFVWKDLGVGILNKGTVHLTLENSLGLNAVNVLALIPEDVAQGYFDSAYQFLEGKRTIHIWEGKLVAPRIIETGEIAGQVSPRSIATGGIGSWQTTHNTENEDINISSDGQSLVIDYSFANESSLSAYARAEFEPEDWTNYNTLSLSVYGDGSGNYLNFWYYQVNPDGSRTWKAIGYRTLNWTGWKELSFSLPQLPRDKVEHFMIALSWDINKSQAGLGSHQIKVKDIVISLWPPEAATTSIDILKDSHYRIGVLAPMGPASQPITLRVNDQEVEIDLASDEEGLKWAYSEPIFLYTGEHELEVYKGDAAIDRLIIFSTNSEETLDDIFQAGNSPATVASWEEISATKYVVHVDAQSPFMLAFAEAHNSHWVAKVNGKEYKSQPLYAVINGFWIDETGELEITIEYKPQRWFDYGAIISMVSLLGAFAFVVWDWRLKRDQRMRSRFRRWFSYGATNTVAIMRGASALVARYWRRRKGEGM